MSTPVPGSAPVRSVFGAGGKHAAILSPAMPVWDGGAFFTPVTEMLVRAGYQVTVYDTLSLLGEELAAGIGREPGAALAGLAARWATVLRESGPLDLVGGAALGGATALSLLSRPGFRQLPALLISSPCRVDGVLDARLAEIVGPAEAGDLSAALQLLEQRVTPAGSPQPEPDDRAAGPAGPSGLGGPDGSPAAARIARGLGLLAGLDLGPETARLTGPQLHLYGELSQLVNQRHAVPGRLPNISVVSVPWAGMRPQYDQPWFVERAVQAFLEEVAA
ncbi:hypothetical protein [Kitasatospora sp. MAP5-34]|uniref:hypothetical protein n=1 Tax=Kitasatospora sp. MAP5-34 TaxID=3035102 RepID=UPI002474AD9E|nr:hypothetical protein [Kitasatospora sp. MAP5-34]MDH6580338.1 pimeloyl-ACP methyl ester carboxylesterase [Kitasatospora sp. MAP5-34]